MNMPAKKVLYCSFCGKTNVQARYLVMGPDVGICDECINLCVAIIGGKSAADVEYESWYPPTISLGKASDLAKKE